MFNQEIKEAFDRVIVLEAERCEASACINEIKSALVAKGGKLRSRWVLLRGTRPEANPRRSPVAESNSVRVCFGSCVDGSLLARIILRFVQAGRVQSCVRPVDAAHMAAGPNAIRGIGSQSTARA